MAKKKERYEPPAVELLNCLGCTLLGDDHCLVGCPIEKKWVCLDTSPMGYVEVKIPCPAVKCDKALPSTGIKIIKVGEKGKWIQACEE